MNKTQIKSNIKRKLSKGIDFTLTGVPDPFKLKQNYLSHYYKISCSSSKIGDIKSQEKSEFKLYDKSYCMS